MKKQDPPGYPGDEAVTKAIGEALGKLLLEKGLSVEEAYAAFRKANEENPESIVPRRWGWWRGNCEKNRRCRGRN